MFVWSARRLIPVLLTTLIACSALPVSSNLTSLDSVSKAGGRNEENGTRLHTILSRRQGFETKEDRYNLTSLFGIRKDTSAERISHERDGGEMKKSKYDLKSLVIRGGKRTKKISDQREGHDPAKGKHNMSPINGVRNYTGLDAMAKRPGNIETKDVMYNWTGSTGFTRDRLDTIFDQGHAIMNNTNRYNWTRLQSVRNDQSQTRIMDHRKAVKTVTGDRYNWTDLNGIRRYIILKRIFEHREGLETKRNRYNWTSKGGAIGDIEFDRISKRRDAREIQHMGYEVTIPDGFQHYYVPSSSIANFLILYVIQPEHMMLFRQGHNVTKCLQHKLKHLLLTTRLDDCYSSFSGDVLKPKWMYHLIGFVILCSIILLVAFFMLTLCPCLMCWQISCGEVVQAGKLDTYPDASWALITLFGCSSILFGLFGVLSVGCAGIGMGTYMNSGRIKQIYTTYDEIHVIAVEAEYNEKRQQHLTKTSELKVCRRRLTASLTKGVHPPKKHDATFLLPSSPSLSFPLSSFCSTSLPFSSFPSIPLEVGSPEIKLGNLGERCELP